MTRHDVIQIRIAPGEKEEIMLAAARAGKSASEWMREVLLSQSRSTDHVMTAQPNKTVSRSGRPIDPIDAALASAKRGGRQA